MAYGTSETEGQGGDVLARLRYELAEAKAANARLRAELDQTERRKVLLVPTADVGVAMQAMSQSRDEEPGTVIRMTSGPQLEWELLPDRTWHRR